MVTVTKTWEDNLSNDERSVPDVSISTEKPSKNPLGYTITYHGNGLTFADGTTENEIIVNSSGKIVSGQYKELSGFLGWYSDKACTQKIKVDSAGLPVNGINTDLDLYAKQKTFVLKTGSGFNKLIPSTATSVVFTDEIMPISATLIDVDEDGDRGVVAWMDGTTMKLSTQIPGQKVVASSCYLMFYSKYLISIDFSNLNTNNVTDMSKMFYYCSGLTSLDLTPLDTSNVTDMSYMFRSCSDLTNLDLTPLDTQNVTSMSSMFSNCSGLTSLDLSHLDTSNVTNMNCMFYSCSGLISLDLTRLDTQDVTNMRCMFYGCSKLTSLDLTHLDTSKVTTMEEMFDRCTALTTLSLGEKFAFVGSDYCLPSGTWYSSNGTTYDSGLTSCTIPNNKADTYTRR